MIRGRKRPIRKEIKERKWEERNGIKNGKMRLIKEEREKDRKKNIYERNK